VEERDEGGEERHEDRHAALPAEVPDGRGQRRRQGQEMEGTREARHRRPRPVGGQVEVELRAAQSFPPVRDLLRDARAGLPLALPVGKVGILEGQLRQPGLPPFESGLIDLAELVIEDPDRPGRRRQHDAR